MTHQPPTPSPAMSETGASGVSVISSAATAAAAAQKQAALEPWRQLVIQDDFETFQTLVPRLLQSPTTSTIVPLDDLLWLSVMNLRPKFCEVLLGKGADPNSVPSSSATKQTMLHVAATQRSPSVLMLLLKAKAAVNKGDSTGLCPLHYAGISSFAFFSLSWKG